MQKPFEDATYALKGEQLFHLEAQILSIMSKCACKHDDFRDSY